MLCARTTLLLAPTLTHTDQDGEDHRDSAGRIPQRRDDCGAPPFLFAGAFRQVRGPPRRAMTRGDLHVVQTGLRILRETPTRFWEGSLRRVQEGRSTALACLTGRRLPPVRSPRCASGPRLGGHWCGQRLPRGQPAAPPQRLRPPRLQGCAQARRPVRRAGHGGLEPARPQLPSHLEATLSALTVGGRPREEHVPPRDTATPATPDAGLPAPAAERLLEHRSSIAPSPLAGEGWDGGAEAGTDTASHTGPHPHPCPPPSRGRESARTDSPIDDLTDVLDGLPPPRGAVNATAGAAPQRRRRVGPAGRHGPAGTRGDRPTGPAPSPRPLPGRVGPSPRPPSRRAAA